MRAPGATTSAGSRWPHVDHEPLIVDWRAPVAEAFYRATGRDPQGLVRRRYFISRGRELLGLEDEFFGDAAGTQHATINGRELRGQGALVAALETSRTGRLSDIVGTIQAEQDEIIRAPMPGVLVVQGGPGTGKTVVALHRAAYLLYTHRFPLEGQGLLVVGPNRLFLGYIEQVLPSLGEAGVELSVLPDLVPGIRTQGRDEPETGRIKGDLQDGEGGASSGSRPSAAIAQGSDRRSGRSLPASACRMNPSGSSKRLVADSARTTRPASSW